MKYEWYNRINSKLHNFYDENIEYYLNYVSRRVELGEWIFKYKRHSIMDANDYEHPVLKLREGAVKGAAVSLPFALTIYRKAMVKDMISLNAARFKSLRLTGKFSSAGLIYTGLVYGVSTLRGQAVDDCYNHAAAGFLTTVCFSKGIHLRFSSGNHIITMLMCIGGGLIGFVSKLHKFYPTFDGKRPVQLHMNVDHWKTGYLGMGDLNERIVRDQHLKTQSDLLQHEMNEYFKELHQADIDEIRQGNADAIRQENADEIEISH